jgi:hypothetical protein
MQRLKITQESIKNELISYKSQPYSSINEYIWNAFDAHAETVEINYEIPATLEHIDLVTITDDGDGWNFLDNNTDYFMASTKNDISRNTLTLPHGKLGRGRYSFIWHAAELQAKSMGKELSLFPDARYQTKDCSDSPERGVKVTLINVKESLDSALRNINELKLSIIREFCWFLEQNPKRSIFINGEKVSYEDFIKEKKEFSKVDFSSNIQSALSDIKVKIIVWEDKPREYAKFFVINSKENEEVLAEHTGLNKKKDNFWHSVYIYSTKFTEEINTLIDRDDQSNQVGLFADGEVVTAYRTLKEEIKNKLYEIRKPILDSNADALVESLKAGGLLPNLSEFYIDENDYSDLLKQVYITAPHLFTGKGKDDQRFITLSIAGLVSSGNNSLVMKVLSQIAELTEEESRKLDDILSRTHLSNVVKTIAEIDDRLQTLSDMESLLFDHEKETLEVKHLQKVLDKNLWLFGENYTLFASTEGAMHRTLKRYAIEKLGIDTEEITTKSRKEVDLFLSRSSEVSEVRHENLIIEIKRPSIVLGKKEYDQIDDYARTIAKEASLNGENMHWEYYLIGDDYDETIKSYIRNASNHGEKHKGLTMYDPELRFKIYVRKWSDIIQVENAHRLKYLKDKLQIKLKDNHEDTPDKLVEGLTV